MPDEAPNWTPPPVTSPAPAAPADKAKSGTGDKTVGAATAGEPGFNKSSGSESRRREFVELKFVIRRRCVENADAQYADS